jgi:hypothetical protein
MQPTRVVTRSLPLLVAALALLALAASAPAANGGARRTQVKVLGPKEGARPAGSSVEVKVRVRGSGFRAYLNGTDVTSRFHGGDVRVATFRPGKALKVGRDNLFVSAGKGRTASIDSSRFLLRKRDPKLLTLKVSRHGGFSAPRVNLRTTAPLLEAKVWLNGKRVNGDLAETGNAQGLNGRLEAARMRFGDNVLKAMVLQEDGRFARRKLSFWVAKDKPIASAGSDRRVGVGGRAMLNGTASRPPIHLLKLIPAKDEKPKSGSKGNSGPKGKPAGKSGSKAKAATASATPFPAGSSDGSANEPLEYEWKILEAPEGSKAKILEPTKEMAELVPDLPGEYTTALTVTAPDGTESVDDMTIQAPQTDAAMGLPIQTITAEGGIQVGFRKAPPAPGAAATGPVYQPSGPNYQPAAASPAGPTEGFYKRAGNWVQMLVINAENGAPLAGIWDKSSGVGGLPAGDLAFNVGQGGKLLTAVEEVRKHNPDTLVVLSGQGRAASIGKGDQGNLKKAIEAIGGTVTGGTTPQGVANLAAGTWSVLGTPGITPGGAYQNAFAKEQGIAGFLGGSAGGAGSVNGYLQSGLGSTLFQFISPEVVSIDTKWTASISEPPSPAQNTIKVGEQKYVSAQLNTGSVTGCPCSVGVQLLFLDPATLTSTGNGTFGVLKMDGETNFEGIKALDEALHSAIGDHGAGASTLVVMQDFGSWLNANWPGGNSPYWLADTLPNDNYTPKWKAKTFPNKLKQLSKTWNESNRAGFGTVAGNLGELVGTGFHDVVANYRRPVYEHEVEKVIPRTWGGLTAIASTNLYEKGAAFGSGQGTNRPRSNDPLLDNGRIVGALSRDNQSQWKLSGESGLAGYPGMTEGTEPNGPANEFAPSALPELVLAPPTPFGCTPTHPAPCPGTPREIERSMGYLTRAVLETRELNDIRDDYTNKVLQWGPLVGAVESAPCKGSGPEFAFGPATCEAMRTLLGKEFKALNQVQGGFDGLTKLFAGTKSQVGDNLTSAMEAVQQEVKEAKGSLLKEETEFNSHEWIEDALFVSGQLVQIAISAEADPEQEVAGLGYTPSALSAAAYLLELSDSSAKFFQPKKEKTAKSIPDNNALIKDRTENLAKETKSAFTTAVRKLGHFEEIVLEDPAKLAAAANNFKVKWGMTSANEGRIEQALLIGADTSFYEAVMPLAFNQWIYSPRVTHYNGDAALELPARNYQCRKLNSDGYETTLESPLANEPEDMSGMNSVLWSGANNGPQTPFTIRALKEQDNDTELQSAEYEVEYGDNYLRHPGASPSEALMKPLFARPAGFTSHDLPLGLGMNKEEFFGMESWKLRQIQCGLVE